MFIYVTYPIWRALQTFELFIATHAILTDGVHWHQKVQFTVQLTTPDYALYWNNINNLFKLVTH